MNDLFSWVPPVIKGDRDGITFDRSSDGDRLNRQSRLVFDAMSDGGWHSLRDISDRTGCPEASVSARLRDLRKPKFGGFTVERRRCDGGLWLYRLVVA